MDWTQSAASANDGPSRARLDDGVRGRDCGRTRAGSVGTQRYKVQFEASEEYVELVERAKAPL
jgi:hypothetical protein